jgi:hypothetical protein
VTRAFGATAEMVVNFTTAMRVEAACHEGLEFKQFRVH